MTIHYSTTGGASHLWQWLTNIPANPALLAWCHTTDGYAFRSMVHSGFFAPNPCPVFGEDLLYFFYGRPAFRLSDTIGMNARAPVIVVLDPSLICRGKRLFPFDTGAFAKKRFQKWVHDNMQLADFELACTDEAPRRHVQSFFGTNKAYLYVKPANPPLPYEGEFEVESIVSMLTDRDSEQSDDRRLAIELQVDEPVPFDVSSVLALIFPDELRQAAWLDSYLKGSGAGIEILTYVLQPLKKASDYQVSLEEKAIEVQERRRLI